ncbi:hypothetical protein SCE1572_40705 [Sorangium cellulosum So0157-2]|uniref:Uncharacterized protein n=1 Tax=Sorangium cellulosum So0157-2 TaxID=1254432 RepID=S4Y7Q3_SORCE|nr:hypothetical protein SCE1572_40705 [Sorangium cellulosum So0157-2]
MIPRSRQHATSSVAPSPSPREHGMQHEKRTARRKGRNGREMDLYSSLPLAPLAVLFRQIDLVEF